MDDRYPEALMRCGAPHGYEACGESLVVRLSLSDNAYYMCNRGHRLGEVGDVDAGVLAVILGSVRRLRTTQPSPSNHLQDVRALSEWWDDASPSARYDLMAAAMDHVSVTPSRMWEWDSEPVIAVHWIDNRRSFEVEDTKWSPPHRP
jgi:hypothetical protein